jgi:hypothetical protein
VRLPWWKTVLLSLLVTAFLPLFLAAAALPSSKRRHLVWGSVPLITNKYWSAAMREAGHPSLTLMEEHFAINRREDFDRYFEDFTPAFLPRPLRIGLGACLALLWVLRRARVVHLSFMGFALNRTLWWRLEGALFSLAGIRTVVLPFGADFYRYSRVVDTSYRYALLASYPELARQEGRIARRVEYWTRRADALVSGMMVEGLGRWDVTMNQFFSIDTKAWPAKQDYSDSDGTGGPVRVMHTPNHRHGKGTEFVAAAVEQLRREGLQVELVLLEGVPNEEVKAAMGEADILAEQFIATAYALSGIEGMARGLPVMANLEREDYTRVFRRCGFLDECPILSTTPESLADNLRILVRHPELRRQLGIAGRAYVEKYHSFETARYLFGSIYERILDGREVPLINLFHPLLSDYNRRTPTVAHPLRDSRLPPEWLERNR